MNKNLKHIGVAFSFAILLSAVPSIVIQAATIQQDQVHKIMEGGCIVEMDIGGCIPPYDREKNTEQRSKIPIEEQQKKLYQFAQETTAFVKTADNALKSFFDRKNRESHATFVNSFKQHLDGFLQTTFASLEAEKKRAPHGDAYHTVINTTQAIVHDIFASLALLYSVVDRNRNTKDARQLARKLLAAEKVIRKKYAEAVPNKLGQLQHQLQTIDPQLAQRITALRTAIVHLIKKPTPIPYPIYYVAKK